MCMSAPKTGGDGGQRRCEYAPVFATLTAKQHEVFALVAENRSSKEIAGRLGVSESAVNQRIEAVRGRTGFPPRAELARAYRRYTSVEAVLEQPADVELSGSAGDAFRVPECGLLADTSFCADCDRLPGLASRNHRPGLVVPAVFVGYAGRLNRLAAIVIIAAGLLIVAMVALGVGQALSTLPWEPA